jgi:hypothetical protein
MANENNEGNSPQEHEARAIEVRSGFVGIAQADSVSITNGGAGAVIAGHDVTLTSGGANVLVAGGNMNITSGGGTLLVAGGPMRIEQGGGAILIAGEEVHLARSYVGLLISGTANLKDGSRVLLTTPQAAALGAALGLVLALANLLRRSR